MRAIAGNTVIQIEVTNACHLSCRHCTRHVGHHRKPFFMSLDQIRQAIGCTLDSPCRIGLMGGEPALHPKFPEVLALYREMIPRERREFWTAGWKWQEYKDAILDTFDKDRVHYNDHSLPGGKHHPLLVAIEEVVEDPELRALLIENCPYQSHWSASITPKGAFFCEIAAATDWLFDGPGGWPVEPGWWKRGVADYRDQIETYCNRCSGALPMPPFDDARGGREPNKDLVSPGNLERLKALGSPKAARGDYEVWDRKLTREEIESRKVGWSPRKFRGFEAHSPEDVPH